MGNIVEGTTLLRVKAVEKGVFTGPSGSIVVCNPEGSAALARYPRVQAQDLRAGIAAGLISLSVNKSEVASSDQKGDTRKRMRTPVFEGEASVNIDELMEIEAEFVQSSSVTNDMSVAKQFDTANQTFAGGSAGIDIGDLEPEHDPETGEIGAEPGDDDEAPPSGKPGAKPAAKAAATKP